METAHTSAKPDNAPPSPFQRGSFARVALNWRRWWRDSVLGTVDQDKVIEERREDAYLSPRYLFMTAMSGGIAILGMLLASPAVVIGAMLLSPLMGPIIGLGFALAIADYHWLRKSARALAAGCLLAIAFCAVIVFVSPLQTVTLEVASRTRPNLFDLLVALFSALAGAYAMIRGRAGAIVGVAIATALMPPLAAVGFGLATFNWTVFSGALLLFVTNLVTIALTAWGVARFYGFSGEQSGRQTFLQNTVIFVVFIGLAVPLGFSLRQIAWEANAARQIRAELQAVFGDSARLSQPEIAFDAEPLTVTAFVWTTELRPDAEQRAEASLERRLDRTVDFDLKQFLVRDESSAEQAQLDRAQAREDQADAQQLASLREQLSLAAGVPETEVLIDRERRRAVVRAKSLPGAQLETYYALERRIAGAHPDWRTEIVPPTRQLPETIEFSGDEPSERGSRAIALAAWAAARRGEALAVTGPAPRIDQVAELLAERGAGEVSETPAEGPVRVAWAETD